MAGLLFFRVAHAEDALPNRLQQARELAGLDPKRARAALATLRVEATNAGRLDWRLSVDEVDCRVLTDVDEEMAVRLAQAGLDIAGDRPTGPALLPWLRLRACHAGARIDGGDTAGGQRELEEVLSASGADALRPAHAMALLEQGVQHSRSGELLRGQQELLSACEMLHTPGLERDLDLCLGHLANHYKRMHDFDEALPLLLRLRDDARARGAIWDASIFALGIAQTYYARGDWPEALEAFRESLAASETTHDPVGQSYAEQGVAAALVHMGRAAEGLPHVDRARNLLDPKEDPKHALRVTLTRAQLLTALGRAKESVRELQHMEAKLRAMKDDLLLTEWLDTDANALSQVGRWREAYQALEGWRVIDERLQQQRNSEQAARLRAQYNRARDTEDLAAMRQLNEQDQRLRRAQTAAVGLFALLLLISIAYALQKFRLARQLQVLASTDELTGLPNRRAIIGYMQGMVQRGQRVGTRLVVLMIDVDHFKRVNDTQGHAIGDELLRHLSRVLPIGLRGQDRVGRLGGEEFLVVLPGASLDHAAQIAARMRDKIASTPLIATVGELRFTVSIGVAGLLTSSDSVAAILARADAALYRAKNGGRNAVVVDGATEPVVARLADA
jgi:diguanylate cyclase (GGDEF)-like protein